MSEEEDAEQSCYADLFQHLLFNEIPEQAGMTHFLTLQTLISKGPYLASLAFTSIV